MQGAQALSHQSEDGDRFDTLPCALVVDDEPANRLLLKMLLKKLGYRCIEAENGAAGVTLFEQEQPDIVFMDVMMPVMDGYEAASQIKACCGESFVPVIFLTALSDDKDLARCIEAGGDDFLTKPINQVLLRSKIQAMERIRGMHREISSLYGRRHQDDELAKKIFTTAVTAENVALEHIQRTMTPLELFSGDVLLTAYRPSGDLNVLLADFTGHGLAAAIGALPVSKVFRSMSAKGFTCEAILAEMNSTLNGLLPANMFMAVQFVTIHRKLDMITVANCGMPDLLVIGKDGKTIKQRVNSSCFPLGIVADYDYQDVVVSFPIYSDDRLLMVSDGFTETQNQYGELFGQERLDRAINYANDAEGLLEHLSGCLADFRGAAGQNDDLSLIEVPFRECLFGQKEVVQQRASILPANEKDYDASTVANSLDLKIMLTGPQQLQQDPVPAIITQIQQLTDIKAHRQILFTILNELYMNAFEHGILRLDSSLKKSAEGFDQYYLERERRLAQLVGDRISISVCYQKGVSVNRLIARVEDSGPGFDYKKQLNNAGSKNAFAGRGILLVKDLCESLRYVAPGNKVEAVYAWEEE